jgi:TPR repeat protein
LNYGFFVLRFLLFLCMNILLAAQSLEQQYRAALICYEQVVEQGFPDYVDTDIERAVCDPFTMMKKVATRGHSGAQLFVGYFYQTGQGVLSDPQTAVYWYKKSMGQGNPEAAVFMAKVKECCTGDYKQALEFMKDAAMLGYDSRAEMDNYFVSRQITSLNHWYFQEFFSSASSGSATDARMVGVCYEQGIGVAPDLSQAFHWYQKSAERGDPEGAFYTGLFYEEGREPLFKPDVQKAEYWYRKAVDMGSSGAAMNLGRMERKNGNFSEAAEVFGKIDKLPLNFMIEEDLLNITEKELEEIELSAFSGDSLAQLNMGIINENGYILPVSQQKAEWWYKRSFASGNSLSACYLGRLYLRGGKKALRNSARKLVRKGYESGEYQFCQEIWQEYRLYE